MGGSQLAQALVVDALGDPERPRPLPGPGQGGLGVGPLVAAGPAQAGERPQPAQALDRPHRLVEGRVIHSAGAPCPGLGGGQLVAAVGRGGGQGLDVPRPLGP